MMKLKHRSSGRVVDAEIVQDNFGNLNAVYFLKSGDSDYGTWVKTLLSNFIPAQQGLDY